MKLLNFKIEKITWIDTAKKWLKRIAIFFGFLILFVLIVGGFGYGYNSYYKEKFFPGVYINKISLSGKTYDQAAELLNEYIDFINEHGTTYVAEDKQTVINPVIYSTTDPDLTREIISFDVHSSLKEGFEIGKNKNPIQNFLIQIYALIIKQRVALNYSINEQELKDIFKQNFSELENPANQAKLQLTVEGSQIKKEVSQESLGTVFDYQKAIDQTYQNINNFKVDAINLDLITDYPVITKENSQAVLSEVEPVLKLFPVKIFYEAKEWYIDENQAIQWMALKYNDSLEEVVLGFYQDPVEEYLKNLEDKINIEAKEGKFDMEGGKVTEFQGSRTGKALNFEQSYLEIEKMIFEDNEIKVELIVDELEPTVTTASINDIGINEIVGVGHSDFSGSPANRRHNIKVGADTLHGLLIKPGEEFSLIKTLGEIDGVHGYLPELVIKGNETKPEYGGGLCQIGTTMFRVCLDTGLPIPERKPHSYRVSYYEPAGTDATIYSPKPDLKCANDTGNYLLLQTRIEGNDLYFEFWGTDDGRDVEMTDPKIWNITYPPATKLIKTTDLAPGKKKCTEGSHAGAETVFYRSIYYNDEEKEDIVEEEWYSKYRAWQAVCLIGVTEEELAEEQAAEGSEEGTEGDGSESDPAESSDTPDTQPAEPTEPTEE